ncbi:enediyne antibiotic chromoprotein [Amycolatopsis suaedae]|uniref:Neocarzinostatin n=1 Tax=Amycolatopsis suaedae TaxID=2510978 RepID=A0A4V2ELC7_9PSEU|nr:enediyne antibiotic chromoprotein [Amycolatopsis suaedae]RZQ61105.1 neocarzinostatin [Amycolatopsis suaedae]
MSTKLVAKFAGGVAVAAGLTLAFQPAAMAAPSSSVTPSSGLGASAVVQVSSSGLKASANYHVGQCTELPSGQFACNKPAIVHLSSSASGTLSTPLTVQRTYEGILLDGTSVGTIDCAAVQCNVTIGDDTGEGDGVNISFA